MLALLLYPLHKLGDALIWSKIRSNLGGRLKVMISGGAALPRHVEEFLHMIDLNIIAGYGLTETSPTLANRNVERNVLGTVVSEYIQVFTIVSE